MSNFSSIRQSMKEESAENCDWRMETRTDGWTDRHHYTIIRPVWWRAYKKVFFQMAVNVGKLEESSRMMLPFRRVCLLHVLHNHFTHKTGRVAYLSTPLWVTCWSFWASHVDNSVNMGEKRIYQVDEVRIGKTQGAHVQNHVCSINWHNQNLVY